MLEDKSRRSWLCAGRHLMQSLAVGVWTSVKWTPERHKEYPEHVEGQLACMTLCPWYLPLSGVQQVPTRCILDWTEAEQVLGPFSRTDTMCLCALSAAAMQPVKLPRHPLEQPSNQALLPQVLRAVAYVFCQDLQHMMPSAKHSIEYISFPLVQKTRPNTSDWPPLAEGPHIYADVIVR